MHAACTSVYQAAATSATLHAFSEQVIGREVDLFFWGENYFQIQMRIQQKTHMLKQEFQFADAFCSTLGSKVMFIAASLDWVMLRAVVQPICMNVCC